MRAARSTRWRELLLLAAQELTLQFNAQGECDHPEIAGAARHALTEESSATPLAERLGTRLMHILVDEFQDTSRDQYELLRTLTQDWSEGDGRTLFLVGDPMQSIYGFRNAEVGRFATVRDGGLAATAAAAAGAAAQFPLGAGAGALVQRSVRARVPRPMTICAAAPCGISPASRRATICEGRVHLYRVETAGRVAEAEEVARPDRRTARAIDPGRAIAVLAGARPHLRAVRAALAARQVPFIGVNLEPLADVPVVRDLEALARALDSPLDRVAWLAVLRAPFVGLSLADLTVDQRSGGRRDRFSSALREKFPGLSADGMERLMRARAGAHRRRGMSASANRARTGRARLARAGRRRGLQRRPSSRSARRFLPRWTKRTASACAAGRSISDRLMDGLYAQDPARPGAVSLMTIHGAKGLEFDHVFVVGVGRRGRGDDPRLLNWLEIAARAGRRPPVDGAHPRARRRRRTRRTTRSILSSSGCIGCARALNARAWPTWR